jgi:hypothetical protein
VEAPLEVVRSRRGWERSVVPGTCAEPPLEVVPPILAVDPGVSGSGCALDGGAGLACRRRSRSGLRAGRQPFTGATTSSGAESTWPTTGTGLVRARNHHFQWCGVDLAYNGHRLGTCAEPPLEVVRSRLGLQRAPAWYVRGTTTGSGATRFGCRPGRQRLGLRPRRWSWARMSTVKPGSHVDGGAGLACRRWSRSGLRASRQPSTGATASSRAGVRRRTDSHEAPLEVVAPMGTVDSGVDRSGFALDGEAGAGCVQGDSLPRVPRLLAVRSTTARGPARGPRLYCPNRSCFVAFPRDSSTG